MLSVNSNVLNAINQNTVLNMNIGAILDINCNSLLDFQDSNFSASDISAYYKTLFPKQSPVKLFRPEQSGVKYAIFGNVGSGTWTNPKNLEYKTTNNSSYRTYMVSKKTPYKHYIANNSMSYGVTYYTSGAITKNNKRVPCNKIVLKFETGYSVPNNWSISINGVNISNSVSKSIPSTDQLPGVVTLYYNGTTWSTSPSSINYNSYVMVSNITLTASSSGYIGLIEIAPHLLVDLTDRLTSFTIQKEMSATVNDILPIKELTANSLSLSLNGYGTSMSGSILFKQYSKYDTFEMDPANYKYIVKNAEIYPFYKMYNASATDGSDTKGSYYKIKQGKFYINEGSISEFGEVRILAIDSCKILQESIAPQTVCHDGYSAFAVIRKLLDISGFTNYNFNWNGKNDSSITDSSIPSFKYWWSDGKKTVWEELQLICNDMQMSVFMDEDNVLQFNSREYQFDRTDKTSVATFRYNTSESDLANIINFESYEIPTVLKNKIIYNNIGYRANTELGPLTSVDKTKLMAGSLQNSIINESTPSSTTYIQISVVSEVDPRLRGSGGAREFLESYSGYILIDSEIIEYDAKQYQFVPKDPALDPPDFGTYKTVWISGENDFAKWSGRAKEATVTDILSAPTLAPTGRYRIKKRGALGTSPAAHSPFPSVGLGEWVGVKNVTWR